MRTSCAPPPPSTPRRMDGCTWPGWTGGRRAVSPCGGWTASGAKRPYGQPPYRGRGLARQLIRRITEDARQIGYRCMLLDTLPVLEDAVRLYRQLGFYEIPCYNDSPVESTLFFQLDL